MAKPSGLKFPGQYVIVLLPFLGHRKEKSGNEMLAKLQKATPLSSSKDALLKAQFYYSIRMHIFRTSITTIKFY